MANEVSLEGAVVQEEESEQELKQIYRDNYQWRKDFRTKTTNNLFRKVEKLQKSLQEVTPELEKLSVLIPDINLDEHKRSVKNHKDLQKKLEKLSKKISAKEEEAAAASNMPFDWEITQTPEYQAYQEKERVLDNHQKLFDVEQKNLLALTRQVKKVRGDTGRMKGYKNKQIRLTKNLEKEAKSRRKLTKDLYVFNMKEITHLKLKLADLKLSKNQITERINMNADYLLGLEDEAEEVNMQLDVSDIGPGDVSLQALFPDNLDEIVDQPVPQNAEVELDEGEAEARELLIKKYLERRGLPTQDNQAADPRKMIKAMKAKNQDTSSPELTKLLRVAYGDLYLKWRKCDDAKRYLEKQDKALTKREKEKQDQREAMLRQRHPELAERAGNARRTNLPARLRMMQARRKRDINNMAQYADNYLRSMELIKTALANVNQAHPEPQTPPLPSPITPPPVPPATPPTVPLPPTPTGPPPSTPVIPPPLHMSHIPHWLTIPTIPPLEPQTPPLPSPHTPHSVSPATPPSVILATPPTVPLPSTPPMGLLASTPV